MKYTLRIFGEGYRILPCSMTIEQRDKLRVIRKKLGISWHELIFNLDALKQIGIGHWSEFSFVPALLTAKLSQRNWIEINRPGQKRVKIPLNLLLEQNTLFPLYQVELGELPLPETVEENMFCIIQEETGQLFHYQLEIPDFDINKLKFILGEYIEESLYIRITYDDVILENESKEGVIRGLKLLGI